MTPEQQLHAVAYFLEAAYSDIDLARRRLERLQAGVPHTPALAALHDSLMEAARRLSEAIERAKSIRLQEVNPNDP